METIQGTLTIEHIHLHPTHHLIPTSQLQHGRSYIEGNHDEAIRKAIFMENLKSINEHNLRYIRGLETYYKAVNKFTDMTWEEFRAEKKCTAKHLLEDSFKELEPIPDYIDSFIGDENNMFNGFEFHNRSGNLEFSYPTDLVPIRDQGDCGSCWAFSSLGVLEYQQRLKKGERVQLSPQELINCNTGSNGCNGGSPAFGMSYVRVSGLTQMYKHYS